MDPIVTDEAVPLDVLAEFEEALEVDAAAYEDALEADIRKREMRSAGGPGSGNFGHAGRPGEVGGSAPSDDTVAELLDVMPGTLPPGLQKWVEQNRKKVEDVKKVKVNKLEKGQLPEGLKKWLEAKKAEKEAAKNKPPEVVKPPETPKPPEVDPPFAPRDPNPNPTQQMAMDRAKVIAERMGFDSRRIGVNYEIPPRTFTLNGQTLTYAGHFDPKDGLVTLHSANKGGTDGVIIHEIAHAQWDWMSWAADREAADMTAAHFDSKHPMYGRTTKEATIRKDAETQALARERWPASYALADAGMGNWRLNIKADAKGLARDDGVSDYSRRWWKNAEAEVAQSDNQHNVFSNVRSAVNETLSEVARILGTTGMDVWYGDTRRTAIPDRFAKLRDAVAKLYSARDKAADNARLAEHYKRTKGFKWPST